MGKNNFFYQVIVEVEVKSINQQINITIIMMDQKNMCQKIHWSRSRWSLRLKGHSQFMLASNTEFKAMLHNKPFKSEGRLSHSKKERQM